MKTGPDRGGWNFYVKFLRPLNLFETPPIYGGWFQNPAFSKDEAESCTGLEERAYEAVGDVKRKL